jgi:hypothetical protein
MTLPLASNNAEPELPPAKSKPVTFCTSPLATVPR